MLGVVRCWGGQVLGWVELRRVAGRGARGCRAAWLGLQGGVVAWMSSVAGSVTGVSPERLIAALGMSTT